MTRIDYGDIFVDYRIGHVLDVLRDMESGSVNMAVTSPPYFGLRDYLCPPAVWDGVDDCDHEWVEVIKPPQGGLNTPDNPPNTGADRSTQSTDIRGKGTKSNFCSKCGAWKGQLGLEPDFNLYIKHLCDIFDEIKRVLRDDGTCFVNLGDTYAGSGGAGGDYNEGGMREGQPKFKQGKIRYPSKSLVMIPYRFAIEMSNQNWVLRDDLTDEEREYVASQLVNRGKL